MSPRDLTPDNAEQHKILLRLMRSIRRGFLVAEAAAQYCVAGQRGSAWQAFCLAQSQYRTSLEMLLLAEGVTATQRLEFDSKLATLMETLAKLYLEINEVSGGAESAHNSDLFRREMLAAGQRLSNALRLEDEFGHLSVADTESVLEQWRESRRLVEMAQGDYDQALMRYRDEIQRSPAEPEAPLSRKTILVLEDEHLVASLMRTILERRGSTVLHASTGDEAVALCERHRGQINLMVADVILSSGAHGLEVARRLVKSCPEMPVLFVSGHPRDQLVNRGLLDPGTQLFQSTGFLQKPFSPKSLEARVHELLGPSESLLS